MLCRRILPRVSAIQKECPDIGQVVKEFVQQSNVGADAWRQTGVLTFDGNVKIPQKSLMNAFKNVWKKCIIDISHMEVWWNQKTPFSSTIQRLGTGEELGRDSTFVTTQMLIGVGQFIKV